MSTSMILNQGPDKLSASTIPVHPNNKAVEAAMIKKVIADLLNNIKALMGHIGDIKQDGGSQ